MALRLVESGVRMVQIYYGNFQPWDNHDDIRVHAKLARKTDGPIAALVDDLKARGLFDETLIVIGSEFGRTPMIQNSGLEKLGCGRDHNPPAFTVLLAGGGVKGGMAYGVTDDFGFKAVENKVHVHDLHATILHQLGFDHTQAHLSACGPRLPAHRRARRSRESDRRVAALAIIRSYENRLMANSFQVPERLRRASESK